MHHQRDIPAVANLGTAAALSTDTYIAIRAMQVGTTGFIHPNH